jgi:hypothetical protein
MHGETVRNSEIRNFAFYPTVSKIIYFILGPYSSASSVRKPMTEQSLSASSVSVITKCVNTVDINQSNFVQVLYEFHPQKFTRFVNLYLTLMKYNNFETVQTAERGGTCRATYSKKVKVK